jgi:hypothetical protein
MTHRLIIIAVITFITLFEFWFFNQVYNSAYKLGYRDGVEKMVTTIDSAFTKQTKIMADGIQE